MGSTIAARRARCTDEQVRITIPVHVPGAGNAVTEVRVPHTGKHAARRCVQPGAYIPAEDVNGTVVGPWKLGLIRCTDRHIADAVTVQVAGTRYAITELRIDRSAGEGPAQVHGGGRSMVAIGFPLRRP